MPTVTYLGDDSNQATVTWCNPMTKESIEFKIDKPVDVNPDAKSNAKRKNLVRHIIDKLSKTENPYFKLVLDAPKPAVVKPVEAPKGS